MRLVLTAGWNRAPHVLALAELLRRRGHEVAGVLVVTPWNPRRLRQLVRARGRAALGVALRKLRGRGGVRREADALAQLLRREEIAAEPLSCWARRNGASYLCVRNLNEPLALAWLRRVACDGVVYGGGGILRSAFLEACGGAVLNAHSGPLPAVRGMNAFEWSLLLDEPQQISVHYIDRGIDTGPLVLSRAIELRAGDSIDELRSRCAAEGVYALLDALPALRRDAASPSAASPNVASSNRPSTDGARCAAPRALTRQVYVLAPALRQLAERKLARATRGAAA